MTLRIFPKIGDDETEVNKVVNNHAGGGKEYSPADPSPLGTAV